MGFDDIEFDIRPNEDYHVKMSDQKSVENKTVVFRLREIDEETIGVMLLSTDFKQGKNLQKSLDKLYQNALKKNFLEKRMKKWKEIGTFNLDLIECVHRAFETVKPNPK